MSETTNHLVKSLAGREERITQKTLWSPYAWCGENEVSTFSNGGMVQWHEYVFHIRLVTCEACKRALQEELGE